MYKIYIFMQKKLIRILARALHEYVNFEHDPEKQYRSLSACWNTGVQSDCRGSDPCILPFWTEALEKVKLCSPDLLSNCCLSHRDFLQAVFSARLEHDPNGIPAWERFLSDKTVCVHA